MVEIGGSGRLVVHYAWSWSPLLLELISYGVLMIQKAVMCVKTTFQLISNFSMNLHLTWSNEMWLLRPNMEVNYTSVTGRLDYVVEKQAWKFLLNHGVRYVGLKFGNFTSRSIIRANPFVLRAYNITTPHGKPTRNHPHLLVKVSFTEYTQSSSIY